MPKDENEFNKRLLSYDSVSVKEILARYRNLYPELATSELNMDLRTDIDQFSSKVKVNVEFFEVSS